MIFPKNKITFYVQSYYKMYKFLAESPDIDRMKHVMNSDLNKWT